MHTHTHTLPLARSLALSLRRILTVVYVIELVIALQLEHHQAAFSRKERKEAREQREGEIRVFTGLL